MLCRLVVVCRLEVLCRLLGFGHAVRFASGLRQFEAGLWQAGFWYEFYAGWGETGFCLCFLCRLIWLVAYAGKLGLLA